MKKISVLAASALAVVTTMVMPVTAQAAPCQQGQIRVIVAGGNNNCNTTNNNNNNCQNNNNIQQVKDQLSQYGIDLDQILNNCNVSQNCAPKYNCAPNQNNNGKNGNTVTPGAPANEAPAAAETPGTPETPTTVTPTAPVTEDNAELSIQEQIVKLVNEERAKAGLSPVTLNTTVQSAAQVRAVESATSFSHTRPNGKSFSTALTEAGVNYRGSGENLAWGQKTAEEVMKGWMNSAGHKANILNPNFTEMGVGYHQNAQGVIYWSQLFIY